MVIDPNPIFDFGFNRSGVKDGKKGEQKKPETEKKLSPSEFEDLVDDLVNARYFPEDWLKERAAMMDYVVQGMYSINPINANSFGHQIGQLIGEIKRYQLDRPKFVGCLNSSCRLPFLFRNFLIASITADVKPHSLKRIS